MVVNKFTRISWKLHYPIDDDETLVILNIHNSLNSISLVKDLNLKDSTYYRGLYLICLLKNKNLISNI